ncbi:MAG: molybdopterin cofactor-binding domain-containing protein [Gammaproteobacteria bacterium]
MKNESYITRRLFLQSTGALIIGVASHAPGLGQPAATLPSNLSRNPDLDTWIQINADGSVSISSGKCEIGQGIRTALAQIVADELDVAIERIQMRDVDTTHSPNEGATTGSNSIKDSGSALRFAAAEARQLLLENAAELLRSPATALTVDDGRIHAGDEYDSVTYWELLEDGRFNTRAGGTVEPKSPEDYRYVGASIERLDLPAKFFGEEAFIQDLRLPGMLHARMVRSEIDAARLVSVETETVAGMPGVEMIVRDGSFLAVVASREEQAIGAAEALGRSTVWETVRTLPEPGDFPGLLRTLPAETTVVHDTDTLGDRETSPAGPIVREHSADYSRPHTAHASMSPSAAVAHWDGALLKVWSHGQGMFPLRQALARVVGLPERQVQCIHHQASGCYGHNGADDAACDAALIAMAVPDRPIRLQWSRHDEFRREPFGPAMSMNISAATDATGNIQRWLFEVWSPSHSTRPYYGGDTAGSLLAAREKDQPLDEFPGRNIPQPAGGADRNAVALYAYPKQQVVEHYVTERPLRVSALRGLGAYANVFAIESFMDELARENGSDPFEYRLRHLTDPRAAAVIEAVRELAGERPSESSAQALGRGIAFAQYKNLAAYLAMVVDIVIDRESGAIRVLHAYATMDAGLIVSPDGARNQVEGGIIQATSWTLKEAVKNSASEIQSIDWASYPIIRFDEVPEIQVTLINRPELPSLGVGEAAQGPTAAAIANAIADATGARLRDLPFTPDKITAALLPAA